MKKVERKTTPVSKKLISSLLVFALLVQTLVAAVAVIPVNVLAASAEAKVTNTAVDSGIAFITTKNLSYYGDRTYKLSLTATSSLREAHETDIFASANDGYMTADAAGYYLLELYGGAGGEGGSTAQGGEGSGGAGGYAYGYVWLNKGDTLVYTIGANGDSAIYSGDDEDGAYAVGLGGDYSAIYKIPADKGYNGSLSENDKLNNYIMIAGGGGGGGAGNGALYPSTGNADGGAGGSVAYGAGIAVSAEENAANGGVAGTYFSGADGETSGYVDGTSYEFIGKGGSNDIDSGSAYSWANGGNGGNGSYRGGAGGSGFAGGTGGSMTDILKPSNVGGGGGGSSFVADSVTVFDINNSGVSSLLEGPGNDNGGKAVITYIGVDPNTKAYTDHLKNVTIRGEISEYFDILSATVDNGTANTPQISGNTVTVTGADITPDDYGYEDADNFCRVDIIIKAKSNFFGGNKVPVLKEGTNFTLTTQAKDYATPDGVDNKHFDAMTFYFGGEKDGNGTAYDDSADYCNVSLNMSASANSYAYSLSNVPNPFITAKDLYNDSYASYRTNLNQFASKYLASISTYSVSSAVVRPTSAGIWKYEVSFTVTPKVKAADAAAVGPVVEDNTTFSDTAIIIVLEAGKYAVSNDGAQLSVDKLLSYDSATDQYKLQVSVSGSYEASAVYNKYVYRNSSDYNSSYTVPVTGYYAIGALGGQGGDGHGAAYRQTAVSSWKYAQGGFGAFGDDVTGYIYLKKGDVLTWYVGGDSIQWGYDQYKSGDDKCGGSAGDNNNYGKGGNGGEASWIAVNGTPVIIAAGGAGGGGAYRKNGNGYNGSSNTNWAGGDNHGNISSINSNYLGSTASYNGGVGGNASSSGAGAAGSQPNSYRSSNVSQSLTVNGTTLADFESTFANNFPRTTKANCTGQTEFREAGVMISLAYAMDDHFANLEFNADFQRYFDLNGINYNGSAVTSYSKTSGGSDGNGTKVTGLKPSYTINSATTTSGNTATVKVSLSEIKYEYNLKAKDGFIGGNDVPLLNALSIIVPYDTASNSSTKNITANEKTDYANVPIKYEFNTENFVTVDGIRINCGDSLSGIDDLLVKDEIPAPSSTDAWKWAYVNAYNARQTYASEVASGKKTAIGGALYETTPYTLTQRIEPKAASTKAVVVGSVSPVEADNHVTVTVVRPVEAILSNAKIVYNTSVDGVDSEVTDDGTGTETVKVATEADLSGIVIPDTGYALPEDINVYVCGTPMTTGYTYSATSGAFNIPASAVRELVANDVTHNQTDSSLGSEHQHDIVISVDAVVQTFSLTFVWVDADGVVHTEFDDEFLEYIGKGSGEVTIPTTTSGSFVTGYNLTNEEWFNQLAALDHTAVREEQEFKWIWGTEDYSALTQMPGVNTTVYGYVTGKTYTVNVHYVEKGTTEPDLTDPTQIYGPVGSEQIVVAPEISGWLPVNASTTVKIEKDSSGNLIADVYIEYVKAQGNLYVYHVKADTNEQLKVDQITISSAGTQTVTLETVDHYSAYYDGNKVTGSVSISISADDVANGKAVYIYYQPDQYKVTFNLNDNGDASFRATDKAERKVAYNNTFGYDADEGKLLQFPQPERKGYTFAGWYTADDDGAQITESTSVNDYANDGGITLYAHWEAIKYKVTVHYVFKDKYGNEMQSTDTYYPVGASEQVETEWNYDAEYSSEVPTYPGFDLTDVTKVDSGSVESKTIAGKMPAIDLEYTVTYQQLTYKLTINFEWEDGEAPVDAPNLPAKKEVELVYGESYSYSRAELEGDLHEALEDYIAYYGDDEKDLDENPIAGTMGTADVAITVTYTESVNIELDFGKLEFTLAVDYDTNTHDYIGHKFSPKDNSNYVTVTNSGKKDIPVSFEYAAEAAYTDIEGSFTIGGEATDKTIVAGKTEATATLSLSLADEEAGMPVTNLLSTGQFTSGTITVTIGDTEAENGSEQD